MFQAFQNYANIDMLYSGATPETVKKAFEILLADPAVKSIFINIFGGMCVLFLPFAESYSLDRHNAM